MHKRGNTMVKGFLHTDGRLIKNEAGDVVILRGYGCGNWMLPEGFMVSGVGGMFGFTPFETEKLVYNIRFDRGRTMHDAIVETCGPEYARSFWPRWYRNMLMEDDIRMLARLGYNSIRLPMSARGLLNEEPGYHFNEDSFAMIDQVLEWCETYKIYAVLDLHGAVGGQSGVSCDDGIDNMPHMFTEPESWERTIRLWEYLADRYKDRWIVAGYELLNEPIAPKHLHVYRTKLRQFYDEAILRIRAIDKRHMIFLQDSSFAHDTCTFDKDIDPQCHNWVMVFHQHHIAPELKSITSWLEASLRLDVPVWYGEGSGEAAELGFFLDMLDDLGIGFNQFSWKAMDERQHTGNEAFTYLMPKDWHKMISYIEEGGPRPSYEKSQRIFDELLEACKLENCIQRRPDLHRDILKKQGYVIPAVGYDSRFKDSNAHSSGWLYGNPFNFRLEDGTKLVVRDGGSMPGLFDDFRNAKKPVDELWLELGAGEHANYTIYDITKPCCVRLELKAMVDTELVVSGKNIQSGETLEMTVQAYAAGCLQIVNTVTLEPADGYTVTVRVRQGCIRLALVMF